VVELREFADQVAASAGPALPTIVAINGHSSSGKSSLSRRLADTLPNCSILHTDDLAWYHGVFSWDELLINDVLPALRTRRALQYRPPAWVSRSREGAITIDNDRDFVIIEGVGASQESVRRELDVIIWVETPQSVRESRDAERVAAVEISATSYVNWMVEENAYMAAERPWEHADLIVDGNASLDLSSLRIVARA
jgi:uridine kinase